MKYYTERRYIHGRWYLMLMTNQMEYGHRKLIGSYEMIDNEDYGVKWRQAMLRMGRHSGDKLYRYKYDALDMDVEIS